MVRSARASLRSYYAHLGSKDRQVSGNSGKVTLLMRLSALMSPFGATEKNKRYAAKCNQGASAQFVALALFGVPTFLVALEPKEPRSSTVKSKG